jgi:hypothetical protein
MQKDFPSSFKHLEDFELYLDKEKGERIQAEVVTTEQILVWADDLQKRLKTELERLISVAFPKMPKKDQNELVEKFFRRLKGDFQRQAILFRNENSELIAATVFDCGNVEYEGRIIKTTYFILRAILKEYQELGLGKFISSHILTQLQPDILVVTCYQSPSLHSWVGLTKKGGVSGFEVYPRLEQIDDKDVSVTVPFKDIDLVIHIFKEMFPGVINYDQERIDKAIRNLTVLMTRKNDHEEVYDFNPWEKNGRKDKLAEALGVTDKDGVVVMFKKILER